VIFFSFVFLPSLLWTLQFIVEIKLFRISKRLFFGNILSLYQTKHIIVVKGLFYTKTRNFAFILDKVTVPCSSHFVISFP